jgi:superfamily II DNA or RNA helicase
MILLTIDNNYTTISEADTDLIQTLDKCLSYQVKGFFYSPRFKDGLWDGKEHLLKFSRKQGYHFPTGLWSDVLLILQSRGIKFDINDKRQSPPVLDHIKWHGGGKEVRPYQAKAVYAAVHPGIINQGRLILKMPIRSGKTFTAAKIISLYKHRTLFVVNSEMLIGQTIETLEKHLQIPIGQIGAGVWKPEDVTVATIQTLMTRGPQPAKKAIPSRHGKKGRAATPAKPATPEFRKYIRTVDMLFFDECHHLEAKRWRQIIFHTGARYRIGLSATAFLANSEENETGTIWLKASCGSIGYEVSISELIDQGYLVPLDVWLIPVNTAYLNVGWREAFEEGIYHHQERNQHVVDWAMKLAKEGGHVLIHAVRLTHIDFIADLLDKAGADFHIMIGDTKRPDRREHVDDFESGRVPIMLGNLFKEGVDLPACDCVINAAGGKSEISTTQRLRNLTIHEGKKRALLIDFADLHNEYLARHTTERLKVYKSEPLFNVKVLK